jgi:hypothetical protein
MPHGRTRTTCGLSEDPESSSSLKTEERPSNSMTMPRTSPAIFTVSSSSERTRDTPWDPMASFSVTPSRRSKNFYEFMNTN